jgi:hypothetical protein
METHFEERTGTSPRNSSTECYEKETWRQRRPRPEGQLGLPLIQSRHLKVRQDLRNDLRLLDAGDHLELPSQRADVDLEAEQRPQ